MRQILSFISVPKAVSLGRQRRPSSFVAIVIMSALLLSHSIGMKPKVVTAFFARNIIRRQLPAVLRKDQKMIALLGVSATRTRRIFSSGKTKKSLAELAASEPSALPTPFREIFDLQLPEGRCVGLELKDHGLDSSDQPDAFTVDAILQNSHHWIRSVLHPEELASVIERNSTYYTRSFLLGRVAMRVALGVDTFKQDDSLDYRPILKDEHGRPIVPEGFLGSISHKRAIGAALVTLDNDNEPASSRPTRGVGVDIEDSNGAKTRKGIARKLLTEREISELGQIPGISSDEEIMLRFSGKESLYKAIHPLICQWVGLHEAEMRPLSDGSFDVTWNLESGAHLRLADVTAHWRRQGEFFLTSGSAKLKEMEQPP